MNAHHAITIVRANDEKRWKELRDSRKSGEFFLAINQSASYVSFFFVSFISPFLIKKDARICIYFILILNLLIDMSS